MSTAKFYRTVIDSSAEHRREEARRVTEAVFHALRDRLTAAEAGQVAAQLPRELKLVWCAGERYGRRPAKLDRDEFYRRVMTEARLRSIREARCMTLAVFAALKEQLSAGEAEDVLAQLPRDLKVVWTEAGTRGEEARS